MKIRQFEELKICPFDEMKCIDLTNQENCKLLPICFEIAKLKLLKDISKGLKSKRSNQTK